MTRLKGAACALWGIFYASFVGVSCGWLLGLGGAYVLGAL